MKALNAWLSRTGVTVVSRWPGASRLIPANFGNACRLSAPRAGTPSPRLNWCGWTMSGSAVSRAAAYTPMATTEHTINDATAELLHTSGMAWQ
jgi:hypothetical protein